jgi:hypothetical protein
MKYKLYILAICVAALAFGPAQASVFSSSSASSLQSQFTGLGYGHIDVTNYQTDLNMKLAGMVDFQVLSKGGSISNLSFGVLQGHERWWGTYYSHHDLVVRMTVHPAPEPATWVLLATGLLGIGVFVTARRKPAGIR